MNIENQSSEYSIVF